jgi:hypothetical protein
MSQMKDFDNILDECLERVMRGETIASCLEAYPEHAKELAPLLETASQTRGALSVTPRPEFRQTAAAEFARAAREMPPAKRGFSLGLRPAWITLIAVLIVLLAGGGTVGAAANSLPDSPLYPVKLATESVRLSLAFSDEGKAELYASFADERVNEIVRMAEAGKVAEVERATERLDDQLLAMSDLTAPAKDTQTAAEETGGFFSMESAPETTPAPTTTTPTTTTPAPTTTTPTTTAPAPTITTPTTTTPPVIITQAPLAAEPRAPGVLDKANLTYPEDEAGLLATVSRQALENLQELYEALDSAPQSVREALLAAIAVADSGYLQVIINLE